MEMADVQARDLINLVLHRTIEEFRDMKIPFERHPYGITVTADGDFTDRATKQTFFTLVYVVASHNQQAIERRAATLRGLDAG